ncbi:MAG: alpha/beta hydrolase [Pseudomonadota bacterium]
MNRQGNGTKLSYYDWGATPFFALGIEPRVSYCLYVPEDYEEHGDEQLQLIVLMHGTERGAAAYRDLFAIFAQQHRCLVLAPLFPCNLAGPGDLDNYKLIDDAGMRFDYLLLAMVDEVAEKYRLKSDRFMLHGFSGGGHFSHRFFYLHPHRLDSVSIGAPGVVSLLDSELPWWTGVADIEQRFGHPLRLDLMRTVPVQMIIGSEDIETWEITIPEDSPWWMPGANSAGATRIERLHSLRRSFERSGITVQFDSINGVAHDGWAVLDAVKTFFVSCLPDSSDAPAPSLVEKT